VPSGQLRSIGNARLAHCMTIQIVGCFTIECPVAERGISTIFHEIGSIPERDWFVCECKQVALEWGGRPGKNRSYVDFRLLWFCVKRAFDQALQFFSFVRGAVKPNIPRCMSPVQSTTTCARKSPAIVCEWVPVTLHSGPY